MSVLHPVGPEPEQTYWVRRAIVVGTALVVVALVIVLVTTMTGTGSAVSANPPPPPVIAASTPTPSAAATPTAGADPSGTATPTATATPKAGTAAQPSTKPSTKPKATPTPKPTKTAAPKPAACEASGLRTTLTGTRTLKVKKRTRFALSLINGTGTTCVATVTAKTFSLTVTSGTDRIWSTDDCAKLVPTTRKTLEAEAALEWSVVWNGRRSASGCGNRPEIPQAGTYIAKADADGSEPVQWRVILTG